MADIDDELLALAGGDSDNDDDPSTPIRDASASPAPSSRHEEGRASSVRPRRMSGDVEAREASPAPSTPNSLESAPMDESDSDVEQPTMRERGVPASATLPPGGEEKYPFENVFASEAEKHEIMAMREVEREQILADRATEVERQRQNRLLRQMVTSVENEELGKKRDADTAELEDGEHKTARPRTGKASETAMDSLRKARAEKQRRKEDQERRRDDFSPRHDSHGPESDSGFDRARSRTPADQEAQSVPPAELRDYEKVRLGRNEFARVCSTPGFEAAITGCFIRASVGAHPETGIEQYRMAVIKSFTSGQPYALSGENGPFVTDQYVKAAHGKAVKEFPFIGTSNSKFTEAEFNRYKIICQNDGITLPTKQFLDSKIDDINRLINHTWTSEEIKARLVRRNELRRRFDPAERERLGRMLDEAVAKGDEQKAQELQEKLDELSTQRLAFRTTLGPPRGTGTSVTSSEQDRLAERNRENRRVNAAQVRKAQMKEKAKVREIELALKRGEHVPDDPSRRLRTKAKSTHDGRDKSAAETNGNGADTTTTKSQQMASHLAKLQGKKYEDRKGLPTIHKPLMDDDIIGALDLDIDVEI